MIMKNIAVNYFSTLLLTKSARDWRKTGSFEQTSCQVPSNTILISKVTSSGGTVRGIKSVVLSELSSCQVKTELCISELVVAFNKVLTLVVLDNSFEVGDVDVLDGKVLLDVIVFDGIVLLQDVMVVIGVASNSTFGVVARIIGVGSLIVDAGVTVVAIEAVISDDTSGVAVVTVGCTIFGIIVVARSSLQFWNYAQFRNS